MIQNVLKLIRIKQWVKNLFVFAPLIFSLKFLEPVYILPAFLCFLIFSLTSSIIYVINDMIDREKDALHPVKKSRPIASGVINTKQASLVIMILIMLDAAALLFFLTAPPPENVCQSCFLGLPSKFGVLTIILSYIILNLFYSLKFKNTILVDVLIIAAGFIFRVYAGAYAICVPVSSFIFMTTLFLSLFLGFSKRKGEKANISISTRAVLDKYSCEILEHYITISAALTIICYALYTLEENTVAQFGSNKLIYSIFFVIYGIYRYIYIINKPQNSEDPTENLYTDKGLLAACLGYAVYVLLVLAKII